MPPTVDRYVVENKIVLRNTAHGGQLGMPAERVSRWRHGPHDNSYWSARPTPLGIASACSRSRAKYRKLNSHHACAGRSFAIAVAERAWQRRSSRYMSSPATDRPRQRAEARWLKPGIGSTIPAEAMRHAKAFLGRAAVADGGGAGGGSGAAAAVAVAAGAERNVSMTLRHPAS